MNPDFKPQLTVNLHDRGGDINKQWHITYKVQNPKTLENEYVKLCKNVNRGKTVSERRKNAEKLIKSLKYKLRNVWNPFIEHDPFKNTYRKGKSTKSSLKYLIEKVFEDKCWEWRQKMS